MEGRDYLPVPLSSFALPEPAAAFAAAAAHGAAYGRAYESCEAA